MKVRAEPQQIWKITEKLLVVRERLEDGWLFLDPETDASRPFSDAELWSLCEADLAGPLTRFKGVEGRSDIAVMTDEDQRVIERKLRYIRAFENAPRGRRSGPKLDDIFDTVAKELGAPASPGQRTVKHWKSLLDDALGDPRVLAPYRPKSRSHRLKDLTYMAMVEFIDAKYLVFRGPLIAQVWKDFEKNEIPRLRAEKPELADQYRAPCENTFRNYIASLDPVMVMTRREGSEAAKRYFIVVGQGPRYERPLQCVQIDSWKKHLVYVAEKGKSLGRLWVAVVIDCYSRVVVGLYIGPEPPRAWTVLQAVRNAMLSKDHIKRRYPEIVSDYPVCGTWDKACFDQGPENANHQVAARLGSLGSVIDYGPKGQPGDRGIVERFFGTMAQALIHRLPGSTFSDIEDRGDYDSVANASLTAEEVIRRVYKWIIDDYHNTVHSELGDTPLNVFKKGAEKHGIVPPPSADKLSLLLSHRTIRTIQREGIQLHNTFYLSAELGALKGRKVPEKFRLPNDPTATKGVDEVEVLYDEGNLGSIWAIDRRTTPETYVKCTARYPEYYEGLAKWQDSAIRVELRQSKTPETPENLQNKRDEMFARFEPQNLSKKRVNRAAARFQPSTAPLQNTGPENVPPAAALRSPPHRKGQPVVKPLTTNAQEPTRIALTVPRAARRDLYDHDGE